MAARLAPDGTIIFDNYANSLLSMNLVTKEMIDAIVKPSKFEEYLKIAELRESCGVKNPPLKFRKPEDYHG